MKQLNEIWGELEFTADLLLIWVWTGLVEDLGDSRCIYDGDMGQK